MAARLGVAFSRGLAPSEIVECARLAESLGYESAWVAEGHAGDQFAILAACATATSRIRLGTGISSVFVRTAPTIAMAAATVDHLSNGRFMLGLGTSHREQVEPEHGVPFAQPAARLRDTVAIVRTLLRDGRVSHPGEVVTVESFDLWFTPARREIPIYVAALFPRMLEICGEIADGALLTWPTLEAPARAAAAVARGAARAGRDAAAVDVASLVPCVVAPTRREALDLMRPSVALYAGFFPRYNRLLAETFPAEAAAIKAAWDAGERKALARLVPDEMAAAVGIAGTAEECRERLQRYRDAGLRLPIVSPRATGPTALGMARNAPGSRVIRVRSRHMRAWIAPLILCAWTQTAMAADGPRPVGTATIGLEDTTTGRKVTSELWFAATPDAKVEAFAVRPPLRALRIARQAAADFSAGKRPLIVISHGNFGSRFSHGWLAIEFVNAGYVVLSTSHPGTLGDDQTAAGRYRLWDRSRDVSFAIDEMLKHPTWSALIDETRIGFAGHSFGGWTGVSLAGGRYDPARQRAYCERAEPKDFYCQGTLQDDIRRVPAADAGASRADARIKAFYLMAAGPGQGFLAESLEKITVPFLVDTAQFDTVLEPRANSSSLARRIPHAREVTRPVGHFAYAPECVGPIPPAVALICTDPDGVDRARVHADVARDAIAFFNRVLGRTQ
ncbi:MAG: LLM class flavin-dependent oxidoreductase [Candidatus Rokubacteria bacterium]|nr:LLM class flavin-dependent oxidoreductase [Candidatus Rokubacteria bacterium]